MKIKAKPRSRTRQFAFDVMFKGKSIYAAISAGINRKELMVELKDMGYEVKK